MLRVRTFAEQGGSEWSVSWSAPIFPEGKRPHFALRGGWISTITFLDMW